MLAGFIAFAVTIVGAWRFLGANLNVPSEAAHLSIVVLPFKNLSGDPREDYFADGVTDNLTTDLSRIHDSFVIASTTAFTYKGKTVDAKETHQKRDWPANRGEAGTGCINARDAMPDGGSLTIKSANLAFERVAANKLDLPPGEYVAITVADTGVGMPPDVTARVFEPFFTTKPLGVGTGLGLSMVYGFVRQSGGQVAIDSEVGKGTAVSMYLPRADHNKAEHEEVAPNPVHSPSSGDTVVVVDDEVMIRMLIVDVLQELGYLVLEASTGEAGLAAVRSNARIDLLITDVGLPGGMNGRQLADAARQARPNLQILFITGYAEGSVAAGGGLGSDMHVLSKPFTMQALGNKIANILQK